MNIRKTLLACLALLSTLCSPGCTPQQEEAPLVDGLQLKYKWSMGTDDVFCDITVKRVDGDHFLLNLETTKKGSKKKKGHSEIRVDRFFRKESGELATLVSHPIWLPSYSRTPGTSVVDDGSIKIRDQKTWEGRDVWVARGGSILGSVQWYFEKDTGFLVGTHAESMGSGMTIKLVKTNASGLAQPTS
jgi:hypothetical protein